VQHRGRFALDEAARIAEPANFGDDPRALEKRAAHRLAHREVEIALAVALLDVLQAVPLVGERRQRFGEHRKGCRP
jgi:hypothetical protein